MILKGRARADGGKLATYLLSAKNEEVRVLDLRGTIAEERSAQGLHQSLNEMNELGKMTRAKSSLFHLAINPSDRDRMTAQGWQTTIEKAEKALGLQGQPRAVVSHLYEGKEHLHVVWSRVDVEQRKCIELPFSHRKLCQAAREIEIDLGLQQTPERARGAHRLKQHVKDIQSQQDARGETPREKLNAAVSTAWHGAGSAPEFKAQIEAAGYQLARGRRGVLVMDSALETYSIARCVEGVKLKDVRARLDELQGLPSVEELRAAKAKERETQTRGTQEQGAQRTDAATGTAQSEDARGAMPTARQAGQMRAEALLMAITPDAATEGQGQGEQSAASEPAGARRARNMTGAMLERELTADNDNAKDAEPEKPKYTPFKGENEAQFAARVARLEARARREAERAKEQPKLEPHLKPKGRGFSY